MHKQTYGVCLIPLRFKLWKMRLHASADATDTEKVNTRLSSAHEALNSKLALIAKNFVLKNEALFKLSKAEQAPQAVPQLNVNGDESIMAQKQKIAAIQAANEALAKAEQKRKDECKELEVKKVELMNTFDSVYSEAKSYVDTYLVRVIPLSTAAPSQLKNPFGDEAPDINQFICLKEVQQ